MRILIVEDERRLAEALGAIMEEQKYSATWCSTGRTGWITRSADNTM